MATWDDVRRAMTRLPGVTEHEREGQQRAWKVRDKGLVWERPLRKSDLAALGDAAPTGPILGIRTVDLQAKEEILVAMPHMFFTIPHFDGHPAVLARLPALDVSVLEHLVEEIWLERAPKQLVKQFLAKRDG